MTAWPSPGRATRAPPPRGPMARSSCTGRWPMLCWHAPLNWPASSCWMSAPGPERSPVGSSPPELTWSRSTPRGRCWPIKLRRDRRPSWATSVGCLWLTARSTAPRRRSCSTTSPIPLPRWSKRAAWSARADSSWPRCSRSPIRQPAKAAIDGALATAGWEPPEWYQFLKSVDGQLGTAATMRAAAQAADLEHVDVVDQPVRTGVTDPRDIVRYRLSQPQRALFLAELGDGG